MTNKTSLLEVAMSTVVARKTRNKYSEEDFELVEAWFDGKISLGQVMAALKVKGSSPVYSYLAQVAREMWLKSKR
jgi:hypothetical protein